MSVNNTMQTLKASQEWADWMEKQNPDAAKLRKQKTPKQNYMEYLDDSDDDFTF